MGLGFEQALAVAAIELKYVSFAKVSISYPPSSSRRFPNPESINFYYSTRDFLVPGDG